MVDSSGLGVGAVVMVVQAGGSVGKMMLMLGGTEGVGMGVVGGGDEQEVAIRSKERIEEKSRKWKGEKRRMRVYCLIACLSWSKEVIQAMVLTKSASDLL